jgi:hypothetical protein
MPASARTMLRQAQHVAIPDAMKISPHSELVEERTAPMQPHVIPI